MALVCFVSPYFPISKQFLFKKRCASKVVIRAIQDQNSTRETAPGYIRSSPRNKVFEDQSRGIVCYRDENGEITCEGYDEGPRFHKTLPIITNHPRDDEIVDLLKEKLATICQLENLMMGN